MGNSNSGACAYNKEPIKMDAKNNADYLRNSEKVRINEPFFLTNIKPKAVFVDDDEDSIIACNIAMTQENDWVVTSSLPKGSFVFPGVETEKRLAAEKKKPNLYNIQQAHSINTASIQANENSYHNRETGLKSLPKKNSMGIPELATNNSLKEDLKTRTTTNESIVAKYDFATIDKTKLFEPKNLILALDKDFGSKWRPTILHKKFFYDGQIVNGYRHGKGTLFYKRKINKMVYDMNTNENNSRKESDPESSQYLKVPIYSGQFLLGAIHSKFAKINNSSGGTYYEGMVMFGQKEGQGVLYYTNGIVMYKGAFSNDQPEDQNGRVFCRKNGNLVYRGGVRSAKRNGQGMEYFEAVKGRVLFKGEFLEDFRHGRGVLYEEDGSVKAVGVWDYGRRIETRDFTENVNLDDTLFNTTAHQGH
jgi:hypothetical protein